MSHIAARTIGLTFVTLTLAACGQAPSGSKTPATFRAQSQVAPPSEVTLYTNDFDRDLTTTLTQYRTNVSPANLDPSGANANAGAGLKAGQAQFADDGDTQVPAEKSVQVDVISDAATYPGGFTTPALLTYDGNVGNRATTPEFPGFPLFVVQHAEALAQTTLSLKFYEPTDSAGPLVIELGSVYISGTDRRIAGGAKAASITLQGGTVSAPNQDGTAVTYAKGAVNTLTLRFDARDTSLGVNGTVTFQINDGPVGRAPAPDGVLPDRFVIGNGSFVNTSGVKLLDDVEWRGIPAGTVIAAKPVDITVNWAAAQGNTGRMNYGLNGYSAMIPELASNAEYAANMAYMNAGLVRYHYAGKVNGNGNDARNWVDGTNRVWNREKIAAAMDGFATWNTEHGYAPDVLMSIPSWPSWMKTYSHTFTRANGTRSTVNGLLDPSEYENYAKFCAELVRILNVEQKRGVRFFEITNERDDLYFVPFHNAGVPDQSKLDELITLYNLVAEEIKRVDPSVQVGGPAFARGDLVRQVEQFVTGTKHNLDFLSFHFYASGDLRQSDTQIYDRIDALGRHTKDIADIVKRVSPDKPIPLHMNEYNISWTFQNNDPRMQNHKGAAFDALAMIAAVQNGTAATNAWNERDNIYGKMDGQNKLRVTGHTFHLFNKYLMGTWVQTSTSDAKAVVPFAVTGEHGKGVALVNRSPYGQRVKLESARGNQGLNGSAQITLHEIAADGYEERPISWGEVESGRLYLPPNSVTVMNAEPRKE